MPLTDLVRLLNARSASPYPGDRLTNPFVSTEQGVVVHFADLRLRSHFLPVVDTASGELHGHAAVLRVSGLSSRQDLDPAAVFVLPSNDGEFVHLDRLVRTLHALNYLTQRVRGNLLLKVHQRHVLSVPADHGLAFEELLRECGLLPTQVTLEIDTENVENIGHLQRAIANYKLRGYGIAIARFGHASIDFRLLEAIRPDIVKLAPSLLGSARPLQRLIGRLQEIGAKVLIEGVETAAMRKGALANGIGLIQSVGVLEKLRGGAPKSAPLEPAARAFVEPAAARA